MERFRKFIVKLILLFLFVPYFGSTAPVATEEVVKTQRPSQGQVEMPEERTATSKTYLKSDGSKQLVVSQTPIHFEKTENGKKKFYDIDANLEESKTLGVLGNGEFKNKSNDFDLKVSRNLQSKAFSIERNGISIEEFLTNISSTEPNKNVGFETKQSKIWSEQSGNKITYKNVAKDTDLTVYSVQDGVKEYITLHNYNGQNVFEFELKLNNTYFEKKEDGSYVFYKDSTKEEVFTIPRFLMWDSKGGQDSEENQYSYEIKTDLVKQNNKYIFKVVADNAWLASSDRVFPVNIDPSFATYSAEDTYVQSGYPTTRAWDQRALYVGLGSSKGVNRANIKFDLPDLRGARIDYAQFDVYQYANCYGSCTWSNVNAYTTGWFNPWDVHWWNQPGLVSYVGTGRQTAAYGWLSMGVTDAVRQWFPNYQSYGQSHIGGLALYQSVENSWGYRTLASRNNPDYSWGQPKLTINYNDYNAAYNSTNIPEMIAGTTVDVPVSIFNNGRNTWFKGGANPTKIGYHLVNNATGEEVVWDGGWNEIPYDIGRGGSATAIVKVKVPPIAGSYTIKYDLVHSGITWFSHQGIATSNRTVNVFPPSLASMTHLGQEKYYTMAGPVDLASGNLSISATDLKVSANSGSLDISRSYNSNQSFSTFSADSNGYIRNWLHNGPYKENNQAVRLSRSYITNEEMVRPNTYSSSNNNIWLPASEPNTSYMQYDWVFEGLGAYQRGRAVNVAAYSHVYVYSPERRTVQLRLGSDDGVKAWLNGSLVHNNDIYRGLVLDSDIKNVTLESGWNSLLVKTSQGSGGWNMSARFTDLNGLTLSDLSYSLNNPELYDKAGVMGKNWSLNFEESLFTVNAEDVYYKDPTGSVNQFVGNNNGTYQSPPGSNLTLTRSATAYTILVKDGTKKVFNLAGKLLETKNLSGVGVVVSYNEVGQVVSLDDSGRSISLSYYPDGKLSSVANAVGQSIVYNYENGRLSRAIDNDGYSYKYIYDNSGRMVEFIDKNDGLTKYEYTNAKVTKIINALNQETRIVYSQAKTEVFDALNRKNTYNFDSANLLSSTINAKNYGEKYIHDKYYNRTQMMPDFSTADADYYSYQYSYDGNNNLTQEINPIGEKTIYTYSGNDLVKVTDPKNLTTEYTYSTDGRRLLLAVKDAEGSISRTEYDALGRKIASITPKGERTVNSFNEFGDTISVTSPKGEMTTYQFDSIGRKIKDISPLGTENIYVYDSLSRMSKVIAPGDLTTEYQYDPNSNKIKEINPIGTYKTWVYDKLNRVLVQKDEAGAEVAYEYDVVGNKVKQTDAKGKITLYEYDVLNKLIKETDAVGQVATVGYNKNGAALTITDTKNQVSSQTYDKAGQVKTETNSEGTSSYTYDVNGNVQTLTSPKENLALTYNKNNEVVSESSSQSGVVTRTYDQNQAQTKVETATTRTEFVYDTNGSVSQVKATISPNLTANPAIAGTSQFTRDAESKLIAINKANGDIVEHNYDIAGRVSAISTKNSAGEVLAGFSYEYDKSSNQTRVTDASGLSNFYQYDVRNQLVKDNFADYSYDTIGNRTEMVTQSGIVKYFYDDQKYGNRLTRVEYPNGRTVSYEYDNNGNTTKKIDSVSGTTIYRYDSEDYFVEAVLSDGTKVEYSYDEVSKRRTQRKVTKPGGQVEILKFTFDGDKLMSEADGNGKLVRSYTWDENENLISVAIPDASGALKFYYFVKNAKGDVVGLSDQSGKLVASYGYDSWGNITKAETLDSTLGEDFARNNPRLYSSYWYDSVLGQYFMKARMYDAEIGRFLSQDPIEIGENALSSNPYLYCDNNPITRIDPSGKAFFIPVLVVGVLGWAANAYFAYEDVKTLTNKKSSTFDKSIATVSLGVSVIPGSGFAKAGAKGVSTANKVVRSVTKAKNTVNVAADAASKYNRWVPGNAVDALTQAGKEPSWNTVRQRYWKNEALKGTGYSVENLERMKRGLAPKTRFGESLQIHHINGRGGLFPHNINNLEALEPLEHARKHGYKSYNGIMIEY